MNDLVTTKGIVWRVILFWTHILTWTVWPTRVRGRLRVPATGPALIVANHQSFLDIPLVSVSAHHRHVAFVARESLGKSRILDFVMRHTGAIRIDPERGDRAALRRIIAVLEQGGVVAMFPEGSRTRDGSLGQAKKGALLAARQAGAPIIPCALDGSFKVWPAHRRFPRPGLLSVRFGAPIDPESPGALDATWEEIRRLLAGGD